MAWVIRVSTMAPDRWAWYCKERSWVSRNNVIVPTWRVEEATRFDDVADAIATMFSTDWDGREIRLEEVV